MGMFMEATQATAIVLNAVWFAVCCAVDSQIKFALFVGGNR
jgi:hypothetical protein